MMIHLIIGGQKSGKSRFAESLALPYTPSVCYIATAKVLDSEMDDRVTRHKEDRPEEWSTYEAPIHLSDGLIKANQAFDCIIIDCITLWACNLLCDEDPTLFEKETNLFLESLDKYLHLTVDDKQKSLIIVTNEIGSGVIPIEAFTRKFIDHLGVLHQKIAAISHKVFTVSCGIPNLIKPINFVPE